MRPIALVLVALSAACARQPERAPALQPEPARARAALATVHVQNHSDQRITVLYRVSGRAPEIAVGLVQPQSTAELAPVPAGEPIVLVARTDTGAELSLPARSFAIDAAWTWRIPADAAFTPPGGSGG